MSEKTTKILVYHHYENLLLLLKAILESRGYTNCITTNNPKELVRLSSYFSPQVILIDLKLPHVDMFDLVKKLSISQNNNHPSIIVIGLDGEKKRAFELGAKGFIPMSFEVSDVLSEVKKVVNACYPV